METTNNPPQAAERHLLKLTRTGFLRRAWRNNKGFPFVAPAVLLWLFIGLYPVVFSIVLAFHNWNGFGQFNIFPTYVCQAPTCRYVGLDNFRYFLTPGTPPFNTFTAALKNNFVFMAGGTVGVIVIALPLALAMNRAIRGINFFRSLLLLPMVTAGIAVYYVWSFIYQPQGLLNQVLGSLGLSSLLPQNGWLGDINTALLALLVITIWSGVPQAMILYLAGLQTIPSELLEAATVDGADNWQKLQHITWPLLRPVTIIIVITTLSGALQGYEMPLLMTAGGPTNHTNVVGLLVYQTAFSLHTPILGRASAYGWIIFLLGLGLSIISLRSMRTGD